MESWAFIAEAARQRRTTRRSAFGGFGVSQALATWAILQLLTGCAHRRNPAAEVDWTGWAAPTVLVVAPVINLSDRPDWDPIKVTDLVAQACSARPNTAVVPVNLVLASLARRGQSDVRSAAEARALALEFGADATLVTAVTAWQPYDPPLVGLVMQWYAAQPLRPEEGSGEAGTLMASTDETSAAGAESSPPRFQVQRVFNAADRETRAEIQRFVARNPGLEGPYGWQVVCKSQELFMRYCSWACVRSTPGGYPASAR